MQSYLVEMINKRKYSDEKDEKRDLLSNLINANEEVLHDGEQRLGEDELVGTPSERNPAICFFSAPPCRKRVCVLPCWARGKVTMFNAGGFFVSPV